MSGFYRTCPCTQDITKTIPRAFRVCSGSEVTCSLSADASPTGFWAASWAALTLCGGLVSGTFSAGLDPSASLWKLIGWLRPLNDWRIDLTPGRCCHWCLETHNSTILTFLINLGRPGLGPTMSNWKNVCCRCSYFIIYFRAPSHSTWLTFTKDATSCSEAWARHTSDPTWREPYICLNSIQMPTLFFSIVNCEFQSIISGYILCKLAFPTRYLQQPAAIRFWGCGWQSLRRADVRWRLGLKW